MNTVMLINEFKAQALYRLNENAPRIEKCLAKLNDDEVWQRPNESSNCVANLILHLCGNITQYVISSLGQAPDLRQRDIEFTTTNGLNKTALLAKLNTTLQQANAVIENATGEQLLKIYSVQGFEFSGIGVVMHVVEHFSYHTGQIALLTKLMKNEDLGFYAGIDLNKKNVAR